MSLPPDHPDLQNPRASSESKFSVSGRPRQSAWGLSSQPGSRRGLANLNTNLSSGSTDPRRSVLTSPPVGTGPAFAWGPSSTSSLNNRSGSARHTPSASSSTTNFASLIGAQQQLSGSSQLLSSPRSRTTTPFSTQSASSAAAGPTAASSGGGGGSGSGSGGGQIPSRAGNFSPAGSSTHGLSSPTTTGFDRGGFGTSTPSGSGGSSLAKITVTQVFLLLGSITDKEGKGKWESQAESIRKLVADHGMEVFARYFRRLVQGNAPQIFPESRGTRNVENPANYPLLVEEVEKVSKDLDQSRKIAEAIDTSDDSLFRDFDLSTFLRHFDLNGIELQLLAFAFTRCSKADLRNKASSFLTSNFDHFLSDLENPTNFDNEPPASVIATAILQVFQSSGYQGPDLNRKKHVISVAVEGRYKRRNPPLEYPDEIRAVFMLVDLFEEGMELASELIREGHGITDSLNSAEDALRRYNRTEINEEQVAGLLLAITSAPDAMSWKLPNLTNAIHAITGHKINWQKVVRHFDRDGYTITPSRFLILYHSLVGFAGSDSDFDIQTLWGGQWNNPATQLSFAIALTSLRPDQLDAETIPKLNKAYDVDECLEGLEGFDSLVDKAKHDTMISLDAVSAIMTVVWSATEQIPQHVVQNARSVIQDKITLFLCSCVAIPQPWSIPQQEFIEKFLSNCLFKVQDQYEFILHCFWKQNKNWTASKLYEFHSVDPMKLPLILEHAQNHGWLTELCTTTTGFGIDLAALAHRRGLIDLQDWADDKIARNIEVGTILQRFLDIKAQDEVRTAKGEQLGSRTVILAMKTVHQMLQMLEEPPLKLPAAVLKTLQRTCVQAYPRLVNFGGEWDELIESAGSNSNQLPPSADAAMQDFYRRMYNNELAVRDVIQVLSHNKESTDPNEQDLFACMIHGLFDEYACFHEYPLQPLATTAVLFGGIISYRLISGVALNVAREMVLDAVRDFAPESSMFKFGLQALLHILNRLPEWPEYCQELVQIPGLQGTEVYNHAQNALKPSRSPDQNGETNGTDHEPHLANGDLQSPGDSLVRQFMSISVEVPSDADLYHEPDEDVSGKILFVLNNVTDDNLQTKMGDVLDVLERRHHHWFAEYLVEQRAKLQPNYQSLYLKMLEIINNKGLWADVLRETYVSVRRVMNAESTMKSSTDRVHLKNLGTWLGSLTLARDKPIRHKNIAFKELLIEGFETQRLVLVIPFTCEVLQQGARSKVMKPPNPWVNDIISVLMELYDMETTKIQQKFAIEFMLNTFGLPRQGEGIERSNEISKRQQYLEAEPLSQGPLGDGLPDLSDLSLMSRAPQRSPAAMSVPDLSEQLVYPSTGSPSQQERVRSIVSAAVHQAIHDIVQPVVERSVTIASIATKDLVQKDFSLESDESKIRAAYLNMVRPLASSLAHVTCKDPLKQCITNHMRQAAADAPEDLPEGTILMTINDNLEVACEHVRQNAEQRALSEVDAIMEEEMTKRREHAARYPNEPYRDPAYSEWSKYLPEPYKIGPQGLNDQQLEIYRTFGPQARGLINHTQQGSTDSGRQIPDVLNDVMIPNMPNISTPAEQPVLPHQPSTVQSRATPAQSEANGPDQVSNLLDYQQTMVALQEHLQNLDDLVARTPQKRWRDVSEDDPVYEECTNIVQTIQSNPVGEDLAKQLGQHLCTQAYEFPKSTFDIDVKVHLSYTVSSRSDETMFDLQSKFHRVVAEMEPAKVDLVAALLESGWVDYSIVDKRLAEGISAGQQMAVEYMAKLLDLLLFSSDPVALRADFALCLAIIGRLAADGHGETFKNVLDKLARPSSVPTPTSPPSLELTPEQSQLQYVLDEWLALVAGPNSTESTYVVFLQNLRETELMQSTERLTEFVRHALTIAVSMELTEAFDVMDALAKLVILIVKMQGVKKASKPQLLKQMLMIFVVLLNHHQTLYKERFNSRIFCRFFSSVIYEWHGSNASFKNEDNKAIPFVFADIFLLLDPHHFPGFGYAWLNLISHRIFMPLLLKNLDGGDVFAELMVKLLKFACPLLHPDRFNPSVRELYRGIIKLMLILHHDFAEFLAKHHIRLCNVIPSHNNQLRNLVLSAFPSSYTEIPDPMTVGLRVDRLNENKKDPVLAQDGLSQIPRESGKALLDAVLKNDAQSTSKINELIEHMNSFRPDLGAEAAEATLTFSHFVVMYLAGSFLEANKQSGNNGFDEKSLQAHVLTELSTGLRSDTRYYFLSAMLNQLRFPNSHTQYFNYAILHIWSEEQKRAEARSDSDDEETEWKQGEVREQISRIFLERLMVHKPHPWGLLLAMMELFKNEQHGFWGQPFIKATPEAKRVFATLFEIFDNGVQRP